MSSTCTTSGPRSSISRKSIEFWERFLGVPSRGRRLLDAPHVGEIVAHPGVLIDVCWVDLPGGNTALELVHYLNRDGTQLDEDTIHPGNVHVCLQVQDIDAVWAHAVSCGARPVSDGTNRYPGRSREGWSGGLPPQPRWGDHRASRTSCTALRKARLRRLRGEPHPGGRSRVLPSLW